MAELGLGYEAVRTAALKRLATACAAATSGLTSPPIMGAPMDGMPPGGAAPGTNVMPPAVTLAAGRDAAAKLSLAASSCAARTRSCTSTGRFCARGGGVRVWGQEQLRSERARAPARLQILQIRTRSPRVRFGKRAHFHSLWYGERARGRLRVRSALVCQPWIGGA